MGKPAGWVADRLPFQGWADDALACPGADDEAGQAGAFDRGVRAAGSGGVPPVTADAFDPAELGAKAAPPRPLRTLLVTGDSLSMPLDPTLARRLAGRDGVKVMRDPHIGTGISKTGLVDWGRFRPGRCASDKPDGGGRLHRRQRGLPDAGAEWTRRRLLRARTGRRSTPTERAG